MIFVTYPDGTQEVHDSGLIIRVRRGRVVAGSLTFGSDDAPYALDVKLGDPKSVGYAWVKRTNQKWVDQVAGNRPFLTQSGPVWFPQLRRLGFKIKEVQVS